MRRRTKAAYMRLYDDPTSLFKGCKVTLFPNGEPEIWIQSEDGRRSFKIKASDGPAGLGLDISRHLFGAPMTVSGNRADGDMTPMVPVDMAYLSICQYRPDAWSQAFKAWYGSGSTSSSPEYPGEVPEDRQ